MMYPLRTALITGLSVAQAGEFSFVLAGVGLQLGLPAHGMYQSFLGAAIFSMLLTPATIAVAPRLASAAADAFGRLHLPAALHRWRRDLRGADPQLPAARAGHVIIVGWG
jgi:CPA2 family monovalent cation:H+ antiporter-2